VNSRWIGRLSRLTPRQASAAILIVCLIALILGLVIGLVGASKVTALVISGVFVAVATLVLAPMLRGTSS